MAQSRAARGEAHDPETPTPGFYRIRKVKGGPFVAVRVWLWHPVDPLTGEELTERGMRWQCQLNGYEFCPDRGLLAGLRAALHHRSRTWPHLPP